MDDWPDFGVLAKPKPRMPPNFNRPWHPKIYDNTRGRIAVPKVTHEWGYDVACFGGECEIEGMFGVNF